jgi:hypothetical protein
MIRSRQQPHPETSMSVQQLMGRYFSLRQELEIAYRAKPWRTAMIDRLTNELSTLERSLAQMRVDPR